MTTEQTTQKLATSPSGLGSLIRLRYLPHSQLPAHPGLEPPEHGTPHESIEAFAARALEEAEIFMSQYIPAKFQVKSLSKTSPPSKAHVELLAKDITSSDLPKDSGVPAGVTEHWFARKSLHDNKAESGTASWNEFDHGLRQHHSQHEKEYTPDVVDAHESLSWNEQLAANGGKVGNWEDVQASIFEMCHNLPTPLNKRVFPVLVLTARKADPPANQPGCSFLVVQIPVGSRGIPGVKYHNAPKVTGGIYCSIERTELVEDGKKVRWQMATASDAKGSLPMWAQKMGVPGAVVKDVGLFIKWVEERRRKGGL